MDVDTLKSEHPEVFDEVLNLGKEEQKKVTKKAADEKKGSEEVAKLSSEVAELSSEIKERDKRIAELEKQDTIRREKEMKANADSIWSDKLSKTSIPDRLFSKIQKGASFSYSDYVDEEKGFDEEGFSKAVDEEITDWEGIEDVKGSSFVGKSEDDDNTSFGNEEAKEQAASLLKLAGNHKE